MLYEGHKSNTSMHFSMTKMYQDLNESFWWSEMKRDVIQYVVVHLTYHPSDVERHLLCRFGE